jgi:hypothetical protein
MYYSNNRKSFAVSFETGAAKIQQLFGIQNSDSLERMGNPVIDNAIKFQQASQPALQLQALNSEIDLMTKRFDLESQVFTPGLN